MRILAATSVRNEGPYLVEWLAWMRLIGVTDITIVANDCDDGTDRLLAALDAAGVINYLPHEPAAGKSVQWQALKMAWQHPARKTADWMLIADIDEFPMIHTGNHRLADLFAALPKDAEAITLPWRLFGNAGIVDYRDEPVTVQFTRSAPPGLCYPIAATFFKTLFRPVAFQRFGVHRPAQKPGSSPKWLDSSGRQMPPFFVGNAKRMSLLGLPPARGLVELHHYSLRSAESFLVKTARGLPNRTQKAVDLAYWVERNFNTVENRAALALQEPLAAETTALKALPGVAEHHEAAVAWHRARFAGMLREDGPYTLFSRCLQAGSSAVLPDEIAHRLLLAFQQLRSPGQRGRS